MSDFYPNGLWSLHFSLYRFLVQSKATTSRGTKMILVAEILGIWLAVSIGLELVEAVVVRVKRDEEILPGRR